MHVTPEAVKNVRMSVVYQLNASRGLRAITLVFKTQLMHTLSVADTGFLRRVDIAHLISSHLM